MTSAEGRQVAERWLSEARIARDTVRFALPPSITGIAGGDLVAFPGVEAGGRALYRVDRVDHAGLQTVDAVRVEPSVYTRPDMVEDRPEVRKFTAPTLVYSVFLDLSLMTGDEVPHAPQYRCDGAALARNGGCLQIAHG